MQCPTNVSAKPNTILTDTQVSFVSNPDTNTSTQYPYRATVTHNDIQANMTATVVFSNAQATSGNYAPFCQTFDGGLYIYAKVNTTITIPTIRIDGVLNYYNLNGTVGSDAQPIKIVNGQAVEVTNTLATEAYASNPNNLVNNVNDWLKVDLNNKDADVNRTTILNDSVTTNRPQQAGESIYCYFGTRFVFWQANGFVTIFVIGQGSDSNAHIWINNYNANVGTWIGWKRIPIAYELGKYGIFQYIGNFLYLDSSTVPFGWISVNGILNYVRTGPKCGFISFACKFETEFTGDTSQQQSAYINFINSFFKVGEVSVFGQKLGVSFKTTGFETYSGRWWGHKNSTGVLSSEYGNSVCWHGPSDTIYLGRMFKNGGLQYGACPFSALAGDSVIAMDIYVEEN